MKIAAYQAPLDVTHSLSIIGSIREQVDCCESHGVKILCCPEAVIGGLADYANKPNNFAVDVKAGQLRALLKPLASQSVSLILGFTEAADGRLYNSAAVFHKGSIIGIYRKLFPAINRSVYDPGSEMPVFSIGGLRFGIIICNDSNYDRPARTMAELGVSVLFVPTNNGLPHNKAKPELIARDARNVDVRRAIDLGIYIVRADVAGKTKDLMSFGSSAIVDREGNVLQTARRFAPGLLVADIDTVPAATDNKPRSRPCRKRSLDFPKNTESKYSIP